MVVFNPMVLAGKRRNGNTKSSSCLSLVHGVLRETKGKDEISAGRGVHVSVFLLCEQGAEPQETAPKSLAVPSSSLYTENTED